MQPPDAIDEVLDFAIEREIEANQLYTDLARQAENATIRKLFESLAKEELGHKAKLEAMKANETAVTTAKLNDFKIADYLTDAESKPNMNYRQMLLLAMKKETASFNIYTDLAEAVESQPQKEIFLTLARQEENHKRRFEIEYNQAALKKD